jgi:hypothetical protein
MLVHVDDWLQNALREPCSLGEPRLTLFDLWLYSQVVMTGYNRM